MSEKVCYPCGRGNLINHDQCEGVALSLNPDAPSVACECECVPPLSPSERLLIRTLISGLRDWLL